ncbi:MAG: sensor histidine kinase [Cyanobacteriota bacterium]|nr:sensor histidine kinase [Cyanobacteriota bacterium]
MARSFRLPLYLEWILLGIASLSLLPLGGQAVESFFLPLSLIKPSSWLMGVTLLLFGLLGWQLPNRQGRGKWLYTLVQFFLIFLLILSGGRSPTLFPALLLIVVIRSCLIFGWPEQIAIGLSAFAMFLLSWWIPFQSMGQIAPIQVPKLASVPFDYRGEIHNILISLILNSAILFALVLVFVMMLMNAMISERQSREKLSQAHHQLQAYALRIEDQATLQERNRIAREIHDALGHALAAQIIQLDNALFFIESSLEKARSFLLESRKLAATALQEVRYSIRAMRSDPLQNRSLEVALSQLVREFEQTSQISTQIEIEILTTLSNELNIAIFRIIQEALTNIQKHSQASHVKVRLQANSKILYALIEDNGKGFDIHQNTTGFGLQGMRERTAHLSGQFHILTAPNQGCRLSVYIPLLRTSL